MSAELASPGGVPPWDPPGDEGDRIAHEGWEEWVLEQGTLAHRMQLLSYQIEKAGQAFLDAMTPAITRTVEASNTFVRTFKP